MKQTYIVGRTGNQPFEIEPTRLYVHGQHARLTVDTDSQDWYIEDLKGDGGNGVFIRDSNGDFRRVMACRIRPTDIVRLGPENANSFTFMAHHALSPDNYNYEFAYNRALERKIQKQEAEITATIKKHNLNTIIAPIIFVTLSMLIRIFVPMETTTLMGIAVAVTAIPPAILRFIYRGDAEKLKAIKSRRAKLIQCPKCWRPLSDYDLRNGRCSACKAM